MHLEKTEDSLKQFQTVIFLITAGDVLDHIQQADFERYIQLTFKEHIGEECLGNYVFMVSYLDEGHPDIASSQIAVSEKFVFGSLKIRLENAIELDKELGTWDNYDRE